MTRIARMTDIAVVDYGMGNLRSVAKAIEHVAPRARRSPSPSDPGVVRGAERVVFPGQGAMPDCMREMDAQRPARRGPRGRARQAFPRHLHRPADAVRAQRGGRHAGPRRSFRARCVRFPPARDGRRAGRKLKVPHMGWNEVHQSVRAPAVGRDRRRRRASISCTAISPEPARPELIAGYSLLPVRRSPAPSARG